MKSKSISFVTRLTLFDNFCTTSPPLIVTKFFRELCSIAFRIISWQSIVFASSSLYPFAIILFISFLKLIIEPPVEWHR